MASLNLHSVPVRYGALASPDMNDKQPYWPETLLKGHVQPAAKRLSIAKTLGWHSFRRTFATLLNGGGEDFKTVQELMRHANTRLTLDVYAAGTHIRKTNRTSKVGGIDSANRGNCFLCAPAPKTSASVSS